MINKQYIHQLINQILNENTPNKSELVGYLRDFAYTRDLDAESILYIINALYPILERKLDLTLSDNDSLQDGILDLYSIFSLEQNHYTDEIYEKILNLNNPNLPKSCDDFIQGIIQNKP